MSKPKIKKDAQRYWFVVNTTRDIDETCCDRYESATCSTRRHIMVDSVVTGKAAAHLTTTSKLDIDVQVFRPLRNGSFKSLWREAVANIRDNKALCSLMLNTRKKVKTYSATFDVVTVTTTVRTLTRVVKECDVPHQLIRDYKRLAKSKSE